MEVLTERVVSFYRAIGVARIDVLDHLAVGNLIHIKGHTTDFDQVIDSLHVSHQPVLNVSKGQRAGLRVADYVRKNDFIYRRINGADRHT